MLAYLFLQLAESLSVRVITTASSDNKTKPGRRIALARSRDIMIKFRQY